MSNLAGNLGLFFFFDCAKRFLMYTKIRMFQGERKDVFVNFVSIVGDILVLKYL